MEALSPRKDGPRTGRGPASLLGLLLIATVVTALVGPTPLQAQIRPPEVVDVRFEGNETFPGDSLARAIATRETECRSALFIAIPLCPLGVGFALNRSQLRERDLPRDRVRLILWYRQRGFPDVQVDTPSVVRTNGNARVVFSLDEGRPVIADSIVFTGVDGSTFDGLLDNLPLREGDRLSTIALDATRDSITNRLANRGYAYAEVYRNALRPADDFYNAIVTFDIDPGPLSTYGEISVRGNQNLSVGTVLRTAQISPGAVYRASEIDEATTRLYGLQIVRSASVRPVRSDTLSLARDSVIGVEIEVAEGDAYRVRAGGGLNTAECLNVEARWTSRNFLGGGRLLQVRGRVGNILASDFREILCNQSGRGDFGKLTGLASVEFVQPWIFSTRNSLSASIFVERQALPNIFVRRAVGAQLALSRTIAPQTILTGFYRPEVSELDAEDVLFCTGLLVCDPGDVAELEGANFLSPVGLSLARDRSDDLLNPRRGYRALVDFEHAAAWTTSDFRYNRVVAEASRYVPVGSVVLAGRIKGGWVGSGGFAGLGDARAGATIVHPQKRFYTGGASSVRGFAQSNLGPRVLFATPARLLGRDQGFGWCAPEDLADLTCDPADGTSFQPRPTGGTRVLELNAELRFPVAFLEGVVFGDAGQAWGRDQSISLASLELTPGVGIRFPSPVGPIRVDLAYRFRGAESLSVVTEEVVAYDPARHQEGDRLSIRTAAGTDMVIDWVSTGALRTLSMPELFGSNDGGLQLHVSIGQAF
ncbi:MAG: BamA/TamA family outer membrane protein [Longimicrobiales bacterium]|nr:BamA/TamA family outer membrane protein [Longimicrobiales bacterium]